MKFRSLTDVQSTEADQYKEPISALKPGESPSYVNYIDFFEELNQYPFGLSRRYLI